MRHTMRYYFSILAGVCLKNPALQSSQTAEAEDQAERLQTLRSPAKKRRQGRTHKIPPCAARSLRSCTLDARQLLNLERPSQHRLDGTVLELVDAITNNGTASPSRTSSDCTSLGRCNLGRSSRGHDRRASSFAPNERHAIATSDGKYR